MERISYSKNSTVESVEKEAVEKGLVPLTIKFVTWSEQLEGIDAVTDSMVEVESTRGTEVAKLHAKLRVFTDDLKLIVNAIPLAVKTLKTCIDNWNNEPEFKPIDPDVIVLQQSDFLKEKDFLEAVCGIQQYIDLPVILVDDLHTDEEPKKKDKKKKDKKKDKKK